MIYVLAYPCILEGSCITGRTGLVAQEVWKVHRELVDAYNQLSDRLKEAEPDRERVNLYKHINYILEND